MNLNEMELIEQWIAGRDAEAFNALVRRFSALVYGASLRVLGNGADAEEVAQECFLALARLPVAPRKSLAGWLHRLATHRALDHRKADLRRRRREEVFAERRMQVREPSWDDVQSYVDEAIQELPGKIRIVVVAHFLEQETQKAIAERLGISHQTVSHRVAQGIELIRTHLRRRGMAITASSLLLMFSTELVVAVPSSLTAALGKLALAGAAVSPAGTGASIAVGTLGSRIVQSKFLTAGAGAAGIIIVILGFALGPWSPWGGPNVDRPIEMGREKGQEPAGTDAATGKEEVAAKVDAPAPPAVPARPSVSGRVIGADGKPVAGAQVAGGTESQGKLSESTADAEGLFRLSLDVEGPFVICAYKPTAGIGVSSGVRTAQADVEVRLEPLGAVSGFIYDPATGEGIDDIKVELARFGSLEGALAIVGPWFDLMKQMKVAESFSKGRYRFTDLPPGKYWFCPEANSSEHVLPGYYGVPPAELVLLPGEERTDVDFALAQGGSVKGAVLDPEGKGLPGAKVHIVSSAHSVLRREAVESAADGTFRFRGLAPGASYAVVAEMAGMAQSHSETVSMPAAEEITGVDVHMAAGHSIHGRLVDEDGNGVAGATFRLAKAFWNSMDALNREETVSGGDGSFTIRHVGPGEYKFVPRVQGFEEFSVRNLTMPADHDLRDQVFVLKRLAEGFVSGRVTDESGKPLEGIRLIIMNSSKGPLVSGEAWTDRDGKYRFDGIGKATRLQVDVYPGGFARETRDGISVNSSDVDFKLVRHARVAGRVLDARSGEPVKDFKVRSVSFRIREYGHPGEWKTVHSESGGFVLEEVEPPAVRIKVHAEGYAPFATDRIEIKAEDELDGIEIHLSRGASIHGIVLDAASGRPIPGARVRVHDQGYFHTTLLSDRQETGESRFESLTNADPDGRFQFETIEPGKELGLVAWHEGYGTELIAKVAAPAELTVHLHLEGRLRVKLEDGGAPVKGVMLQIVKQEKATPHHASYWNGAMTKDDGTLELSGLPPGRFKVALATKEGRQLGILWAEVKAGETVNFELDASDLKKCSASISGTVRGANLPERVFLRLVSASDPTDVYGGSACDRDGKFRLEGVPAGEYTLRAIQQEPARQAELKITVQAGCDHEVQVEVE